MNTRTWILVADASRARIFSVPHKASLFKGTGKELELVDELEHQESREMDSELVSDKPGKFGKAMFIEPTDPKKHEEDIFALQLARILSKAHIENHYHELIFIAPPGFMGMLNKHLTDDLKKCVDLKIEKDYTRLNEKDIVKHLQDYL